MWSGLQLEQVAEASSGPLWFQLYPAREAGLDFDRLDRAFCRNVIQHVASKHIRALLITVSTTTRRAEHWLRACVLRWIRSTTLTGRRRIGVHPGWPALLSSVVDSPVRLMEQLSGALTDGVQRRAPLRGWVSIR